MGLSYIDDFRIILLFVFEFSEARDEHRERERGAIRSERTARETENTIDNWFDLR